MGLTANALKDKIKKMKEAKSSTSNAEWPNCVFMPEGTHKGRFIIDPNGDLYDRYWSYGYFNKGIRDPKSLDKSELPEGFDPDTCDLKQLADILTQDYHKWSRGAKSVFICYFFLIDTDSKSENWAPGNLYCVIGNNKFATAFNNLMTGLEDSVEELVTILDPEKQSNGCITITLTSGVQGSVSMSYQPKKCEPICARELGESDESYKERLGKLGYRPLSISYIRPGWNQEKYDNLVEAYKKELAQLSGAKTEEPAVENVEQVEVQPKVETPAVVEEVTPVKEPEKVEEVAPVSNDPFARFRRKG